MAVQLNPIESTGLWDQVLGAIKSRVGSQQAFETCFPPTVPKLLAPDLVELEVPNAFFVDWLHEHYLPALRASLQDVLGAAPEVRFVPLEAQPAPPAARSAR